MRVMNRGTREAEVTDHSYLYVPDVFFGNVFLDPNNWRRPSYFPVQIKYSVFVKRQCIIESR